LRPFALSVDHQRKLIGAISVKVLNVPQVSKKAINFSIKCGYFFIGEKHSAAVADSQLAKIVLTGLFDPCTFVITVAIKISGNCIQVNGIWIYFEKLLYLI